MYYTTIHNILNLEPCHKAKKEVMKQLQVNDGEMVSAEKLLSSFGLNGAVFHLQAFEGISKKIRLFACDCAQMVAGIYEEQIPNDSSVMDAILISRKYAIGQATDAELVLAQAKIWKPADHGDLDPAENARQSAAAAASLNPFTAAIDSCWFSQEAFSLSYSLQNLPDGGFHSVDAFAGSLAKASDFIIEMQVDLFRKYFCEQDLISVV